MKHQKSLKQDYWTLPEASRKTGIVLGELRQLVLEGKIKSRRFMLNHQVVGDFSVDDLYVDNYIDDFGNVMSLRGSFDKAHVKCGYLAIATENLPAGTKTEARKGDKPEGTQPNEGQDALGETNENAATAIATKRQIRTVTRKQIMMRLKRISDSKWRGIFGNEKENQLSAARVQGTTHRAEYDCERLAEWVIRRPEYAAYSEAAVIDFLAGRKPGEKVVDSNSQPLLNQPWPSSKS